MSSQRRGDRRRVLFIQPGPQDFWEARSAYKEMLPHIGLAYVAATTRAAGHAVAVIDAYAEGASLRSVVNRATRFAPDVIAVTANSRQIFDAATTAQALRRAIPGAATVLGGYHVTAVPEETLRAFPEWDYAVYGEGERAVVELIERLGDPRACAETPGVVARHGDEILHGPDRENIAHLDALPLPAFDLFDLRHYYGPYTHRRHRALTLTTARGCPYKCVFCQNTGGLKYRYRSIELVMEEIEHNLRVHAAQWLFFTDETFTLNRKRATAFCEAMIAKGLHRDVRWFCGTRVDAVDRELIALMKRAGCFSIFFGVESGSEEMLSAMKKKINKEEAARAVRWAREAGIFTHTGWIFGNPNETRETILETIRFAIDIDSDSCSFNVMIPYPGTEILRMAREGLGGLRLLKSATARSGPGGGFEIELDQLSRSELERLRLYAYARFYGRPEKLTKLTRVSRLSSVPIALGHIAAAQIKALFRTPTVAGPASPPAH